MTELRKLNLRGIVSDDNSSITPLAGGATFTGDWVESLDYGIVFISVYADQASATDGLSIQQSTDGTNADHGDSFTIPAGTGKTFSINPHARYLRVVYTNGGVAQTAFRLQTILKGNSKPSTHRLQDDIIDDDDAELNISILKVQTNDEYTYKNVSIQNPLPVDGDSVYAKDLDLDGCIDTGWTAVNSGTISDLFGDVAKGLTYTGATNPKNLTIAFKRAVITTGGMGIVTSTGDFSNVKLIAVQADGTETVLVDNSADNTDRTILTLQFAPTGFNAIRLEFHTADNVTITNVVILKAINTVARIQALTPSGIVTDIDATAGGNLKISLEELESGISSNSNSQMNVTPFHADGTEGALISGVNYESGKSGIDSSTESLQFIDYAHHEIHSGDHFFIKNWTDIAGSTTIDFLAVTPNTTRWGHLVIEFQFEAEANIIIYEGTTTSADGAAVTSYNRNRNSATSATLSVYSGPTVTGVGTQIAAYKAGSGTKTGGAVRANAEIILKQNTKYLIRIQNDTATANWCDYLADWYEHTDLN